MEGIPADALAFAAIPSTGISAMVSMGFTTEDFIEDSVTRTDSDMGSADIMGSAGIMASVGIGIMGSVAVTETRRG
ncbi:MAG: hypothetical protein ACHBNF_15700 [Chromatiales bacterium]